MCVVDRKRILAFIPLVATHNCYSNGFRSSLNSGSRDSNYRPINNASWLFSLACSTNRNHFRSSRTKRVKGKRCFTQYYYIIDRSRYDSILAFCDTVCIRLIILFVFRTIYYDQFRYNNNNDNNFIRKTVSIMILNEG